MKKVCRCVHSLRWKSLPSGGPESNKEMSRGQDNRAVSCRRVCVCVCVVMRKERHILKGKDEGGKKKERSRCCTLWCLSFSLCGLESWRDD